MIVKGRLGDQWFDVKVLDHESDRVQVGWTGREHKRPCTQWLRRSDIRTPIEFHRVASERFDIGRYPIVSGIFGRLSEERQKQAVRMLASNIKCVADETFNIEVKASSVETSLKALGITPDAFPTNPGTPVEVVCDQAVAALAAIIKPSQQSESLVKVSDIAAKTAAIGPQVWEAATTGGSAAYCKQLLDRAPSEPYGDKPK